MIAMTDVELKRHVQDLSWIVETLTNYQEMVDEYTEEQMQMVRDGCEDEETAQGYIDQMALDEYSDCLVEASQILIEWKGSDYDPEEDGEEWW
jgi:hypothetical protein